MATIEQMDAATVAARRAQGDDLVLLDVREPHELEIASVPGALHIPMRDIPARLEELDPERETVVMCHKGSRSTKVAGFLIERGFEKVFNLTGGIDAWSQQVDPNVARY
jgi:rhodanese-related sulfurtransferase